MTDQPDSGPAANPTDCICDPCDEIVNLSRWLTTVCDHDWTFFNCGIDADALAGRGPQRANFRCTKCALYSRREVIQGTALPNMRKPVYHQWVRP